MAPADGALTLNAGQDFNARAATVNAGQALTVLAGRDVNVKGSSIIADQGLLIDAARNLSVLSVEETSKSYSSKDMKKSGLTGGFASGVVSLGYGKSGAAAQNGLETVTQAASSIGSLNGSVQLKSGETLQVVASDIAAKENLGLVGKNVDLAAAQNTSQGQQSAQSKSYGFSAGLTVNPLAAFKDAYKADTANTKNGSFIGRELGKGEGAGDGAWAATTVVTTQFGSQSANSTQNHAISAARASSLTAGKDLTIIATDGSISSQGAQMSAEGNALLLAKNHILFDAAHTVEGQSQDARRSGFSFDNRSPMMVGTLHNQGNGNGATDTVTGTKLSVGGNASMATQTGDIALTGANVVSEGQLSINAARNLTISSAQDMVHNANQSDNKAVGTSALQLFKQYADTMLIILSSHAAIEVYEIDNPK